VIRRPFRRGLTLGLLGAATLSALRTLQHRRTQPAPAAPTTWEPIPDTTPVRVPEPTPAPVVEVHTGVEAEAHFADASRQVERPLSDWEPSADLPPATETTPLTPSVVAERPKPDPAVNLLQEAPKAKKAAKKAAAKPKKAKLGPWVEPVDGTCPDTHPVKGKLASKIFHVPGGFNYPRTRPDRCYLDAAAAEADGLRLSKR
jgi:hypothetical protein